VAAVRSATVSTLLIRARAVDCCSMGNSIPVRGCERAAVVTEAAGER
jgi:hypothetical protein